MGFMVWLGTQNDYKPRDVRAYAPRESKRRLLRSDTEPDSAADSYRIGWFRGQPSQALGGGG